MPPTTDERRAGSAIEGDPRWVSVLARNREADGSFVYAVQTTGVYCRPSCAARRARLENVRFHATCAAAEAAGFRPCKRCRPDAGYASASRVYEATGGVLGMTPSDYRAGGANMEIRGIFSRPGAG